MGTTSSEKLLINKNKDLIYDQYTCIECNLVPKILKIDYNNGIVEFECPNHGEKKMEIKEYLQKEENHLYSNLKCSIDEFEQRKNLDKIFDYCIKCKKYFCQSCSQDHEHKSSFIKVNELNNKCQIDLNDYKYYCQFCKCHFCNKEEINCKHKIEEIITQDENNILILKKKKINLIKRKEILSNIIKLLDIIITTYSDHPNNYFNSVNISNIAKNINEEDNKEYNKENKLLAKINILEDKVCNYLNFKLETTISREDKKLDLSNKNINNHELNLISEIRFNNLEEINFENNKITDISPIQNFNLTKLKKLNISFNKINSIIPLKKILVESKNIENVNLSNNSIEAINVNELKDIPHLNKIKEFNLDNNKIQNNFDELRKIIGYTLKYKLDKENDKIRLFGEYFINQNKNNCNLIINGEEKELCEYYDNNDDFDNDILYVKLFINKNFNDMSFMFYKCSSLLSLPDISKWNTSNVTNFRYMFSNCSLLSSLPDISQWDTSNVIKMDNLFSQCSNLKNIPDISKWNIDNVLDMSYMFYQCSSLESLPDLSKWKISNVNEIYYMFSGCSFLMTLPDLSNWKLKKITNLSCLFQDCWKLTNLPDISKWNISKVTDISGMFSNCENLTNLPDISKWDISKVTDISGIFSNCKKLTNLPDISKWKIKEDLNMNEMFKGCSSLKSLYVISKWNISSKQKEEVFSGCPENIIPDKFK